MPSTTQHQRRCMFGVEECTHPLVDVSPRALKVHLEQYHSDVLNHDDSGRYECQWRRSAEQACKVWLLGISGLAMHIRRVHLRADEVDCQYCGGHFVRPDALEKHIQRTCKEKPKQATMQGATGDANFTSDGE